MTATIATAALVLAACGGDSGTNDPAATDSGGNAAPEGTLVYGESTSFPENLNPLIAAGNSVATANILIRVFPAPFVTLPDFSIAFDEDLMASEPTVEVSGETQTVTYEINEAAVWSDGTPITAADFAFTYRLQRSSDPADGGCESLLGTTGYDQITDVTDDDGKSVTVTFGSPFPDWKSLFTLFPAHVLDKGDDAANCEATTTGWPIATGIPSDISGGPWQLKAESINAGQKVLTLTPNPEWYGEGPSLAALTYQDIGSEATTTVSALQNGEVNLVSPQPQLDLVQQVKNLEPDVTSEINFGLSFEHFDMNLQNVHLKKPEVRKAFALALDREALVAGTVGQFDDRAQLLNNRFYVNNQPEYTDNAPAEYNAQDTAGAKELLESVGYTLGPDGIYTHPADGPLQLKMSTTQNNPLRESTIDLASAQLKDAGFSIEKFLDADIFAGTDKPTSLEARGFDIALFAWVSSPYVSGNVSLYETGGGQNYAGVSNTEVDDLLAQLSTEVDAGVAADLANQADTILWDEMATLPLYQKPIFTAWSNQYEGIEPNATNAGPVWNSDKISLVS
ncbi:MAG: ABC transporter family substrate-binding protein [Geodermatophilaceae bacterium]|nr:ABC transporter family substrate-binding protein [Geodermatophilaceae bacterium]